MKFKVSLLAVAALASASVCGAQQAGASPQTPPATTQNSISLPALSPSQINQALRSPVFDPLVAQAILQQLAAGMESHNLDLAKSLFDTNSFSSDFFERMAAAFDYFGNFSVYYHLQSAQSQSDAARAEILTDFQMEGDPQQDSAAPQRREANLQFTLARVAARGGAQWQIVQVTPADFLFRY